MKGGLSIGCAVLWLGCGHQEDARNLPRESILQAILEPPVHAKFIDLSSNAIREDFHPCEEVAVAVATGKADVLGETLKANDLLLAQGVGSFDVRGEGLSVLARIRLESCAPHGMKPLTKHVVRANVAPELAWAAGTMRAHLDAEPDPTRSVYIGRLEGTAAVAEHVHDPSWEILCAIDAAGTFALDGEARRLRSREIAVIPPRTKHSWKPDEKSKLVAIQFYWPPGPEQRFVALAAAARDAGAADGGPTK